MTQETFVPLTHAEKRIYVTQKQYPDSCMWNVPSSIRLAMVDPDLLVEAIDFVVRKTPGLHARFTEKDGLPVKYRADGVEPVIERIDFSGQGEEAYLSWAEEQSAKRLPMLDDTPYRLAVADAGNGIYFFYSAYHHIAVDGGGRDLVARRVLEAYEALAAGRAPEAYGDLPLGAAFDGEQEYLASGQCARDKACFSEIFETVPDPMDLAGRPMGKTLALQKIHHCFSAETTGALMSYCASNGVSPFRVVTAAMAVVLSRILRRGDIVIGTATANRHPKELGNTVGMFVNSCGLRMQVEPDLEFGELVAMASSVIRGGVARERYPYDMLAKDLRDRTGETPDLLACTLVEMVRTELPHYAEYLQHCHGESLIPLACFLYYPHRNASRDMTVEMAVNYNQGMFEPWRIEQLVRHIENVIRRGVLAPDTRVSEMEILGDEEKNRILNGFNRTRADWEIETTVHECIEATARRFPGHKAVVYRGRSLTYAQLDARANILARKLRNKGAGPGTVVGLLADRSVEIIVGQLAILKSGAAFMPIDAAYPDARIQFMLTDVNAPFILTRTRFLEERDFGDAVLINLDEADLFQGDASSLENRNRPGDLCAVIYTSGSTGKPKGVMLEHRSLCNVIHGAIEDQGLTPDDRLSKHASFSFDASMLEVFAALMSGAQLHIIPEEIRLSLSHLNEYYETHKITWAFLTTQLGEQFMEFVDNHSLKTLLVGGEKLRTVKSRNYRVINIYGPTECSIYATHHTVEQFEENIPIGRPVPNCRIHILDKHGHPQAVGYGGELCISGPGVGRGYHQRPGKTAECFVPDPFRPGEIMYRTGDLACFQPDGNLLHLGRMDRQVKLRGFRIELGEIENAMLSMEGITEAAVGDFKDRAGRVFLCGYYSGTGIDPKAVRQHLITRVPGFMVPAHMIPLESMPVNPSGKIDRKKLPRPGDLKEEGGEYAAPEGRLEKTLVRVWAEVLELGKVSANADFFHSGGDSLRAVALQLTLSRELGREVPLSAVFECPTPRKMARYMADSKDSGGGAILPAPPAEFYPATVSQQQLFLLSRMQGIGTAYNMPIRISFKGPLDHKKLSDALLALIDRHESLRTAFEIHDGKCMQQVRANVHLKLEFARTQGDDPEVFAKGFVRPFDLTNPPLMRTKLVACGTDRHLLMLDFHHIAFDGISMGIFLGELMALYRGENLEPMKIQHKDFAVWEAGRIRDIRARHEAFWFDLFADPPQSELPTDRPRPGGQSFEGASYHHLMDPELSGDLGALARKNGATLHQVFLAGLSVLAGRWSDSDDICIGTSMGGRDQPETAGVLGMFVRTLPTRLRPAVEKNFLTLLAETRDQMRAVYEHGEYPISSLYEHLGVHRGPGRHPLFDINFVMRNTGMADKFESGTLTAEVSSLAMDTAKFDLSFSAREQGESLAVEVDYRTSLYERDTVARMVGHLIRIFQNATREPDRPLGEMDMIGPEERAALLTGFNPPATPPPDWPTVCHAISRNAGMHPDDTAVVAGDGTLTYGELDRLSNRAARAIREAGGGPDKIVAVVADRSTWAVVGMLAALKSGSAYVGIDMHYPPERVSFILEDTQTPCLVGTLAQVAGIAFPGVKIPLDGELPRDDTDPGLARGGGDLAYCIFTSGSTGTPKGVLIEHCAMVNFINWYAGHHRMDRTSGCAAFASFSFDVSVVQIFAPLVSGSCLHIIPEDLRLSPKELDGYFSLNNVTHAHFPTQFAEQFMRLCKIDSLKYMIVGGDRLKSYRLGNYRLTNEYGPSETTMACLSYDVPAVMPQPPVGAPVANTRIYIIDSRGELCPIGMSGEICVAGTGVGRGYLNRGELTARHFVEDPFNKGERMFRTGDKGRWLGNGTVDFIGRMDFQVKIRGYRVEPGEIENRIKETGTVLECVVVPLDEPNGNKSLAAYFTPEGELDPKALKQALKKRLPDYMVPAYFVPLDKMPLSPNGKIDRAGLPRPEIATNSPGRIEPRTPKEKRIATAWENVLGHRRFGLFDSFYDMGGDSLSAISLLADLSETFDISASDLFAHTTIAEQAAAFKETELERSQRLLKLKDLVKPVEPFEAVNGDAERYEQACGMDDYLDTGTVAAFDHVLITGATGTLGIYLLRELLTSTQAFITAIVRAEDNDQALDRLTGHYLERFCQDLATASKNRLNVLAGNLARPDFGLEQDTLARLENRVDAILNSAALTSHYGDWDLFVAANITSVENLVAFARRGCPKAMHHISTTSVGAGGIQGKSRAVFTEFDIDMGQKSGNSYIRSKLSAEIILEKARGEGLPVSIYRAGNITCDSVTKVFQRNVEDNAFYQQLRAYVNLGAAPDHLDMRNMTYVDQAARAIVLLMGRPGLAGQTFHIQNPRLLSLSKALSDDILGLRLSRLPFDEFIEFFARHAGCIGFDKYVERLLLHLGWQDWLADPTMTQTKIEVKRSVDLLNRCGFKWKEPEPGDLGKFLDHALLERAEMIRKVPEFKDLDNEILMDMAARMKPEHFKGDHLLQQEKQPTDGIRFVMDGMVETYRRSGGGWIGTVRVGGPGACLGDEIVPMNGHAINSVEAIDNVFAFQMELESIRELMERHPSLGLAVLRIANTKLDQAERLFVTL